MANHNLQPVRSYGEACVPLRFGFCPYGSSTAGTVQPFIPLLTRDPLFGLQPRWGGASVLHDGVFVGRYNILLDDDWQDFIVNPEVRCNLNVSAPSVFFPSTTSGSGIRISGVQPGPGVLATIPVIAITAASGGGGTTSSAAISGTTITITAKTAATNATVVANINANTGTLGVTAMTVGTATDVFYVGAYSVQLSGGANNPDEFYASWAQPSTTAGNGVLYTANQPGAAGNAINITFVAGGGGTAASAALTGNKLITITIDTSATNATVITAVNVTAAATVGKLITASLIAAGTTAAALNTAMTDVYAAATTYNVAPGTNLSGGGLLSARMSGAAVADANNKSLQFGVPFFHLNLDVYKGDTLFDLSAQSECFVPSQGATLATASSGILYQSVASAAVAASVSVLSTGGAGNGVKYVANQPGDAGNNIAIVYNNPLATLFLASTTGGSGNLFTAVPVGAAGRGVQISQSTPTGAATVITVIGSSINIQPKAGETVAGITTAFNGNAPAASLATASSVGTTSDLVVAVPPANLGGGYTQAASSASAVQASNANGGFTIFVNFGTGATNTNVLAAVNLIPGQVVTPSIISSSGADVVIATNAVFLTGGTDPSDLSIQMVYSGSAATACALASNVLTITVATAGDTNANIAAAVNSLAGNNSIVATVIGSLSDTNLPASQYALPALPMVCHNLVALDIMARNSMNGVV